MDNAPRSEDRIFRSETTLTPARTMFGQTAGIAHSVQEIGERGLGAALTLGTHASRRAGFRRRDWKTGR